MRRVLHELSYLENWRALSLRIRCALEPDEPRLIEHYLAEGRYLARFTATPQPMIAETTFRLLMDTARDTVLPWHWRCLCLDQVWRPLRDLQAIATTPDDAAAGKPVLISSRPACYSPRFPFLN